jgi:hypothetical protein
MNDRIETFLRKKAGNKILVGNISLNIGAGSDVETDYVKAFPPKVSREMLTYETIDSGNQYAH